MKIGKYLLLQIFCLLMILTEPSYPDEWCDCECPTGMSGCQCPCNQSPSSSSNTDNNAPIYNDHYGNQAEAERQRQETERQEKVKKAREKREFEREKAEAISELKGLGGVEKMGGLKGLKDYSGTSKLRLKKLPSNAVEQAGSAKYHGDKAIGSRSLEDTKIESGMVFDDGGVRVPVEIGVFLEDLEVPEELKEDPEYISIQKTLIYFSDRVENREKQLDILYQKLNGEDLSPKDKGNLQVEISREKAAISQDEYQFKVVKKKEKIKRKSFCISYEGGEKCPTN